jgi:hypothetical protein
MHSTSRQSFLTTIATIVQGRLDMACTPRTAYDLHKAWPESTLFWIADAGHSAEVITPSFITDANTHKV